MKNNKTNRIIKTIEYIIILLCVFSFAYGIKCYSSIGNTVDNRVAVSVIQPVEPGIATTRVTATASASPSATASTLCCCKTYNPTNCTRRTYCGSDENIGSGCSSSASPSPTASPCPDGYYGDPGDCTECPVGYACSEGEKNKCNGKTSYQDKTGKDECKQCELGYMAIPEGEKKAHTDCTLAPITSLTPGGNNYKYLAKGEQAHFILHANNKVGSTAKEVTWTYSSAGWDITTEESMFDAHSSSSNAGGSGSTCQEYKTAVSATNPAEGSGASSSIGACVYCSSWVSKSGHWRKSVGQSKGVATSTAGCLFYEGAVASNEYTVAWNRCCGVPFLPDNYGYCYGDEPYIGIATKVKWFYSEDNPSQEAIDAGYPFRYDHSIADNKDECHTYATGKACNASPPHTDKKEVSTEKCEETTEFDIGSYSIDCSGDGNFYTITCGQKVYTNFDYGNDGSDSTDNNLLYGQGFEYKIGIKTKTTCNAIFNPEVWNAAYDRVMTKMKKVKSVTEGGKTAYDVYIKNDSDKYAAFKDHLLVVDAHTDDTDSYLFNLYTDARAIEAIVTAYNNYQLENEYNEEVDLKMNHIKTNSGTNIVDFVKIKETNATPTKTIKKTHNLGVSWLENPSNYKWVTSRTSEFIPEKSYLEKKYGEVQFTNEGTVIDGGNKIYIDYDTDPDTTIPMTIIVTGLGGTNSDSKITNDKCSVKINTLEVSYRPIDVSNPFINNRWKKGENWANSKYDFTSIINSNIWSLSPSKTIELESEDISALKESTANYFTNGDSPYLGTCDYIRSNNQDSITRTICNKIS